MLRKVGYNSYEDNETGITVCARNMREARGRYIALVRRAFTGDYRPVTLTWRDVTMTAYRNAYGWHYCPRVDFETGKLAGGITEVGGNVREGMDPDDERNATVGAMARHIVQNGWREEDGLFIPEHLMPFLSESDRELLWSLQAWHIAFNEYSRTIGVAFRDMTAQQDNDARMYAERNRGAILHAGGH